MPKGNAPWWRRRTRDAITGGVLTSGVLVAKITHFKTGSAEKAGIVRRFQTLGSGCRVKRDPMMAKSGFSVSVQSRFVWIHQTPARRNRGCHKRDLNGKPYLCVSNPTSPNSHIMSDIHNKATRSYNMSRIRNKDTKPEMVVRRFLNANGFRYRLHDKKLPGKAGNVH